MSNLLFILIFVSPNDGIAKLCFTNHPKFTQAKVLSTGEYVLITEVSVALSLSLNLK